MAKAKTRRPAASPAVEPTAKPTVGTYDRRPERPDELLENWADGGSEPWTDFRTTLDEAVRNAWLHGPGAPREVFGRLTVEVGRATGRDGEYDGAWHQIDEALRDPLRGVVRGGRPSEVVYVEHGTGAYRVTLAFVPLGPPSAIPLDNGDRAGQPGRPSQQRPIPLLPATPSPPSPSDSAAAFARLVADLADRDAARRRSLAALIHPVLDDYLRSTPAPTYDAKAGIADAIADALARFGLTLAWAGRPSRLDVGRDGPGDSTGHWLVTPAEGGTGPARATTAVDLPSLAVRPADPPAATRGPGRPSRPVPPEDGLFAPLDVPPGEAEAGSARRVLEAVKARLKAMPHDDLADKKRIVGWLGGELGKLGLSLRCPRTGHPAVLLADRAGDANSRFVFFYRDARNRQRRPYSTTDFDSLLGVISLMPGHPPASSPLR